MTIQTYVKVLGKKKEAIRQAVIDAQREATVAAVRTAVAKTAPNDGIPRGVNMVTGNMARHWAADSKTEPVSDGHTSVTELNCDVPYASYVNNGHWLHRHFVPGLYIDGGLVNRTSAPGVGLIVAKDGKKWVEGRFMETDALEEYRYILHKELEKIGQKWEEVIG